MTRRAYRRFSKEFKLEAIRLADESGKPKAQVARELGIRVNQIGKWRKELEDKQEAAFSSQGRQTGKDAEIQRLRPSIPSTLLLAFFSKNQHMPIGNLFHLKLS